MAIAPQPGTPLGEGQHVPRIVWTNGAGTRVEVIELTTQRGRVTAYKFTRFGMWLGDYQSPDELAKVVDLTKLDEL